MYIVITRLEALLVSQPPPTDATSNCVLDDDLRECQYLLETICKIISCLSHRGWIALVTHPVSPDEKPGEITREGKNFWMIWDGVVTDQLLQTSPN